MGGVAASPGACADWEVAKHKSIATASATTWQRRRIVDTVFLLEWAGKRADYNAKNPVGRRKIKSGRISTIHQNLNCSKLT
jgi:hypothetical protein